MWAADGIRVNDSSKYALTEQIKRREKPALWQILMLILLLAGVVHWWLPFSEFIAVWNVVFTAVAGVAVVAASQLRPVLFQRPAWLLLGLAVLCSATAHLSLYIYQFELLPIGQEWAISLYLVTYFLLVCGLARMSRRVETRNGALLDSLMLVVAAATLFWAIMVEPALATGANRYEILAAAIYPVADLLLLMYLLKLVFLASERTMSILLLMAAASLQLIGDVAHSHGIYAGWYNRGGLLDLIWYGAYALLAAAAWHPSAAIPLENRQAPRDSSYKHLLFIGMTSISVPAALVLLGPDDSIMIRLAAVATLLLFVLMMMRSSILLQRMQRQAGELESLSLTDSLTGAANRRKLMARLREELSRMQRTDSALALAFVDLDHFKRFNDEHGHEAGDDLLRECVRCWQAELRETDLLARAGGEEFVLIFPDTREPAARGILQRLQSVMPRPQTFSAGLAHYATGDTADSLLKRADDAMYTAKSLGRNRILSDSECSD